MTIAACYVSGEGVVFGADSTSTMAVTVPGTNEQTEHHFNYGQKIYEIGENSTLGIATWGAGSLGDPSTSYRSLVAMLADDLVHQPAHTVEEVAWRWTNLFWERYNAEIDPIRRVVLDLASKAQMSEDEEAEFKKLDALYSTGFCIGGYVPPSRVPEAYQIIVKPHLIVPLPPRRLTFGNARFWGWQNIVNRLVWGVDGEIYENILASGKWTGTRDELAALLLSKQFSQPTGVPLREAIDLIHASIYATIKAMKFSHLAPYCGGPIEIAVVSTDRRFRWVLHKDFDEAVFGGLLRRASR
jgi:hypothetical protein